MKLISCHIEGYGKMKNKDIAFDKNITEVIESNGYGKSTISSFLKAMFYGLKTATAASKVFLDRLHYYPFEGGKFGGNVVFESEGDIYKIERFFDKRSETKDTVKVYKNDTETTELGENIGVKVFGFDVDTFDRILFITSDMITISTTSDINKKINNDMNNVEEDFDIEAVLKKLKGKIVKAKDISELKEKIRVEKNTIANYDTIENALVEKYERLNALKSEINQNEAELKKANSLNDLIKDWKIYDEKTAAIADEEKELDVLKTKYPHGIASDEELSTVESSLGKIKLTSHSMDQEQFSLDKQNKYESLKDQFKNGVASDEELDSINTRIEELSKKRLELDALRTKVYDKIVAKFESMPVSDAIISKLDNLEEKYKQDKAIYDAMPDNISTQAIPAEPTKKKTNLYMIFAIISIVLIGCGIGLLFVMQIVGIILLCVGGACLLMDGFMYLRNLSKHTLTTGVPSVVLNQEKVEYYNSTLKNDIVEINNSIASYGYYNEDVRISISAFKNDYQRFLEAMDQKNADKKRLADLEKSIEEHENQLNIFFNRYGIYTSNYSKEYVQIKIDIQQFKSLSQEYEQYKLKLDEWKNDMQKNQEILTQFTKKYHIEVNSEMLKQIQKDITEIENKERNLSKLKTELVKYTKVHSLDQRPSEDTLIDINQITEDLNLQRKDLEFLGSKIEADEEEISNKEDSINRIDELNEKIAEITSKNKVYEHTMQALKEAEQSQKDRYAKPVKDRFTVYSKIISDVIGEKIYMDKDYKITYEKNGEQRKVDHLSAGELSICALCFRLALLDNMYENNQPFLIMDDPFVNLDKENMDKIKALIARISKDRQIIYFACHDSRLIK